MQLSKLLLSWSSDGPAAPPAAAAVAPSAQSSTPPRRGSTPHAAPSPSASSSSTSVVQGTASATSVAEDSANTQKRIQDRLRTFEDAIKKDKIDIKQIRALSFEGVPEKNTLRPCYWKLLLNYLPLDRQSWPQFLEGQRAVYKEWVRELVVDPHAQKVQEDSAPKDVSKEDHPLNMEQSSTWNTYFKDQELLFEIDKDVKRTFPHLHFFQSPIDGSTTKHSEAIKRILFIYAKLNKGIRYVQGMNEILAPIYYVFATDGTEQDRKFCEEDAFYCFKNLMSEIMNNFIKSLDQSEVGIGALMKQLDSFLKEKDLQLWDNLAAKKLVPQFYSFRWLTLLLSQEFQLPDVIRLWDSFFADPRRFEFMIHFCGAMLMEQLLEGEFGDNLKLLQNYPLIDFLTLLKKAKELRDGTTRP